MEMLRRTVEGGFHPYSFVTRDPWLDPIRSDRELRWLLEIADQGRREASQVFIAAGGERILGPVYRT